MASVREPAVAGLFYPDLQGVLSKDIDELLLRAKSKQVSGQLRGLISPHAGYMYSGYAAATGYKLLKGRSYETIIVVGPSHRDYFDGISLYPGDGYRTPLGIVPVNMSIRKELAAIHPVLQLSLAGHGTEHSVEVQLPFLQRVFGKFSFLPIVMGDQRREYCELLARALTTTCSDHNVLLIASSDLSHYHPYDVAVHLDQQVIQDVERYDPDALMGRLEQEDAEACGGGPIVAVMHAAKGLGAQCAKILYYCNSGDVTGEKDAVVGYLSAALIQE